MKKTVSHRCGDGTCEHHVALAISDSCCDVSEDRRLCSRSMKKRRKIISHARRRSQKSMW
jgi:hypothetical protein